MNNMILFSFEDIYLRKYIYFCREYKKFLLILAFDNLQKFVTLLAAPKLICHLTFNLMYLHSTYLLVGIQLTKAIAYSGNYILSG